MTIWKHPRKMMKSYNTITSLEHYSTLDPTLEISRYISFSPLHNVHINKLINKIINEINLCSFLLYFGISSGRWFNFRKKPKHMAHTCGHISVRHIGFKNKIREKDPHVSTRSVGRKKKRRRGFFAEISK